jgi:hypothetical protein
MSSDHPIDGGCAETMRLSPLQATRGVPLKLKLRKWRLIMTDIANSEVRELNAAETDEVSGGFIWIAAFAIGALVGYGCRRGGEAAIDYFAGTEE